MKIISWHKFSFGVDVKWSYWISHGVVLKFCEMILLEATISLKVKMALWDARNEQFRRLGFELLEMHVIIIGQDM